MVLNVSRTLVTVTVLMLLPLVSNAVEAPVVERLGPDLVRIQWQGGGRVDVYVSSDPEVPISKADMVAHADSTGVFDFKKASDTRPYFILHDENDNTVLRVAERILPLEHGSNFRDLGGYPAVDGKHIRWGAIYRSAATPMLTEGDYQYLAKLGIKADIDLRSTDERIVGPDSLPAHTGARYLANDYRFSVSETVYRDWLTSLAPQFREIFHQLLRHEGAVNFHCSAGQDRTGVATALVLSALGVPRDIIVQDYLLSMQYRRPQYEFEKLDPRMYPGNAFVEFLSRIPTSELFSRPYLYDETGEPFLEQTFREIDRQWGSVTSYLEKELGINAAQMSQLRTIYLESTICGDSQPVGNTDIPLNRARGPLSWRSSGEEVSLLLMCGVCSVRFDPIFVIQVICHF